MTSAPTNTSSPNSMQPGRGLMSDRRRGYFNIPTENIDSSPEVLRRIMGRCVILRAEVLLISGVIEYHAISSDFREVGEGEEIPEYLWVVKEHESTVTAQEVTS